jgi:signal transduction histidine kinase
MFYRVASLARPDMESLTRTASRPTEITIAAAALVVSALLAAALTAALGVAWGVGGAAAIAVPAAAVLAARHRSAAAAAARAAALAEERGRRMEELQRLNQMQAEFIASLSHELRTPLNVIIGYSDLLGDQMFGELSSEQQETVRRIGEWGRELLELVSTTLDMSRFESARTPLTVKEVDVVDLLAEIELETQVVRRNAALELAWHVAPDVPRLHTDPVKLKMVIKNLVLNALKFTDEGGVVVRASASAGGIEFTVADSGIGIAPDMLRRIFEPFRQGDHGGERRGGVGLGLHIVRRLLDMLGGRIEVESEVQRGSTFRVWIPSLPHADRRSEPERVVDGAAAMIDI